MVRGALQLCSIGRICDPYTGFVAKTIHTYVSIALYTANAYSVEREMSTSACNRSVAGSACAQVITYVSTLACDLITACSVVHTAIVYV